MSTAGPFARDEGNMTDESKGAEIESPCVKICQLHPEADICIGCYRSRAEIGSWTLMTVEERRRLMAQLPSRAAMFS